MAYNSRATGPLTQEERDVQAALARHGCTTDGATSRDWTPVAILWRLYRDWYAQHRWDDTDAMLLTRRQFGRAVRRLFPGVRRCKRAVACRNRQWGYAFLAGGFSIKTRPARKRAAVASVGHVQP